MHALGGIRLMTLNTMAGEALDLLGTGASTDRSPPEPGPRRAWVRPEATAFDLVAALFVLIYAGLPFPQWRRRHRIA